MKLNNLFQCPEDSMFGQYDSRSHKPGYCGSYHNLMTCIPFGSIVGVKQFNIVVFGMGIFNLLLPSDKNGRYYRPDFIDKEEEATKIMESLLEQLDEYHGKI